MLRYRHEAVAVILRVVSDGVGGQHLAVLAWKRHREPFAQRWALPSGPLAAQETIEQSVRRHLSARLDLASIAHLEQLETHSNPSRDPAQRTIATAYLGLVPSDDDAELPGGAQWLSVDELPELAFDHGSFVAEGVRRMRSKLSYTNVAFALAPGEFTMTKLCDLYSAALGYRVEATNLQRVLSRRGQLEATGKRQAPGREGGRPASVFRFTEHELQVTDPFATLRPNAAAVRGSGA